MVFRSASVTDSGWREQLGSYRPVNDILRPYLFAVCRFVRTASFFIALAIPRIDKPFTLRKFDSESFVVCPTLFSMACPIGSLVRGVIFICPLPGRYALLAVALSSVLTAACPAKLRYMLDLSTLTASLGLAHEKTLPLAQSPASEAGGTVTPTPTETEPKTGFSVTNKTRSYLVRVIYCANALCTMLSPPEVATCRST